jgi:hypothetical protein
MRSNITGDGVTVISNNNNAKLALEQMAMEFPEMQKYVLKRNKLESKLKLNEQKAQAKFNELRARKLENQAFVVTGSNNTQTLRNVQVHFGSGTVQPMISTGGNIAIGDVFNGNGCTVVNTEFKKSKCFHNC